MKNSNCQRIIGGIFILLFGIISGCQQTSIPNTPDNSQTITLQNDLIQSQTPFLPTTITPTKPKITQTPTIPEEKRTQMALETAAAIIKTQEFKTTEKAKERLISIQNIDKILKLRCFSYESTIQTVKFSPKGNLIGVGLGDNTSIFINKYPSMAFHTALGGTHNPADLTRRIAFSSTGQLVASGKYGGKIQIWQISSEKVLHTMGHKREITSVIFSPDDKLLASGSFDYNIGLWDASNGMLIKFLKGHKSFIQALAFHPERQLLASGGGGQADSSIRLWDLNSQRLISSLEGHSGVFTVDFSPDGNLLASAGAEKVIRIWDWESGKVVKILEGHTKGILNVRFTLDGSLLISSGNDGTIRIWNVSDGTLLTTLDTGQGWIFSDYSADGQYIVTGGESGDICLWGIPE